MNATELRDMAAHERDRILRDVTARASQFYDAGWGIVDEIEYRYPILYEDDWWGAGGLKLRRKTWPPPGRPRVKLDDDE